MVTVSARPQKHMSAYISIAMVCSSVEYPFEITMLRAWHFFLKLEFVAFDISSTYPRAPSFLDAIGIYLKMYAVLGHCVRYPWQRSERNPGRQLTSTRSNGEPVSQPPFSK